MEHCLKLPIIPPPKAKRPHSKLSPWVGGEGNRELKKRLQLASEHRVQLPSPPLPILWIKKLRPKKRELPKDTRLKPRLPKQGTLSAIPLCLPTRGISRLQRLLERTQVILGKLQEKNQPRSEVGQSGTHTFNHWAWVDHVKKKKAAESLPKAIK